MEGDRSQRPAQAVQDGGSGVADTLPATHGQGLPTEVRIQQPQQSSHPKGTCNKNNYCVLIEHKLKVLTFAHVQCTYTCKYKFTCSDISKLLEVVIIIIIMVYAACVYYLYWEL